MEGVGYWIFLLILYSLSMMAKKRKQKQAWKQLEDQESEDQPATPQSPQMPGFLQDIFQEIKAEIVEEKPKDDIPHKGYEPEGKDEFDVKVEEPPEPRPVINKTKDADHSIHWESSNTEKKAQDATQSKPLSFLQSTGGLKQAIVLKEVLDKPRSLRRSIR